MRLPLLFSILFFAYSVNAGPGITYHGRILKPDGSALENSSVQFLIQVRSPGSENCLMYEENQTKNMTSSQGIFALTLDDGTGSRTDTPTYNLDRIFSNRSVLTFDTTRCTTGSTYTPASGDKRKFIVYFKDSTMSTWEPMPIMSINYVPMAMTSIEAEQVGAFGANHLIRAVDGSGNPATAPALTPAQLTEFNALIGGTSAKYITSQNTAGATIPSFTTAAPPASPVAGSIWFDTTSAELKYYDGTSTQTLGNASGSSPTGAAGGDLTGTYPNPTIANLAVTNAKVAAAAAIARSKLASGNANRLVVNDASGVMSDAAAITANRALASDANGIPVAVATTAAELGYVNGVTSAIQTQLNGKISPSAAPTTAGQVLRYDGTNWTPNFVAMTDIRSTVTGSTAFSSSGCAANQTLSWNSVGDILTCQSIGSLVGSAISSGTVAAARLGSGTADNTTYLRGDNTWVTAPADATKLPLAGGTMTGALTINKTGSDILNPLLTASGDGESALTINSSSAFDYFNPILSTSRSRGTQSAKTSVASGDTLFELWIGGYDGSNNVSAARMAAVVDGTPGNNDMPTRLEFFTQADGSGTNLEGVTPEMVIKNNGNVGIGLASPTSLLHLQKTGTAGNSVSMLNVESEGEPFVSIRSADNSVLSNYMNPLIATYKSRGTLASPAVVQSGDTAFEMYMLGYDGSTDRHLALISAYVDGTPGANDMPGRIEFHTQPDGSGATLEGTTPEMVIKNDGKVGIGTASPGAKLDVNGDLNVSGTGSISQTAAASKNFFAGPVQQGYAGASSYQGYYSALTDTTVTNDYKYFHQYYLSVTPTADHAGGSATRGVAAFQMETGTNKNMTTLLPISAYGRHGGTGTLSNLVGVSAYTLNDSTGTVSSLRGLEGQTVVNSGTVTDAIGAKVSAETNGGTTSRLIGLQIYDLARNAGTLTNRYGIRIESFTGTAATDDYGIYQAGASQKNYFAGSLSVGTLNAATATHVCIDGTNTLSSCSSSIRYKDHIENLDLGLTDILKLRPVTFKWKNTGEKDLGFVAEEVEKVDPIMATYKDGRIQGVKYDQIVAPIVNAIKELYVMIKNLDSNDEKQNRETVILMQKMNLLETENAQLKNEVKAHQRELDTIKDELLQMKQLLKGRP